MKEEKLLDILNNKLDKMILRKSVIKQKSEEFENKNKRISKLTTSQLKAKETLNNKYKEINRKIVEKKAEIKKINTIKNRKGGGEIYNSDINQKAARKIYELLLQRQKNLSHLRKQHKDKLNQLSSKEHNNIKLHIDGTLLNVFNWRNIDNLKRQLESNKTAVVSVKNNNRYSNTTVNVPRLIKNLDNIIRQFPRTTKPFYVFRAVDIPEPQANYNALHPMPFSTSLDAWSAINFIGLESGACCVFKIKVDNNVPAIMLTDTMYDYIKNKISAYDVLPNEQANYTHNNSGLYEVLLAPGILKEKSRKKAYKITDQSHYDILNKIIDDYPKELGNKDTSVLMIDVEYVPLYVSSNNTNSSYNIHL